MNGSRCRATASAMVLVALAAGGSAGCERSAPAAPTRSVPELLEEVDRALAGLGKAKDELDTPGGQAATSALEAALAGLKAQRAAAMPRLLEQAMAAEPARRAALLECYGRVGEGEAAPALLDLVLARERHAAVRSDAARVLLEVAPEHAVAPVSSFLAERPPLPDAYSLVHQLAETRRPDALPALLDALRSSPDRSVRCHAATGLGHFAVPEAADALAAAATGDEYPAVRTNALRALPRVAKPERVREVAAKVAAADPDANVRSVAASLAK